LAANGPPQLVDDPALPHESGPADRSEVHVPEPVIDGFEADLQFGELVTGVDPAMLPAHPAIPTDEAPLVVAGIDQRRTGLAHPANRIALRPIWVSTIGIL
jgi:hypothetical protein